MKVPDLGLENLATESFDSRYQLLDVMSVSELLKAMNQADFEVPVSVAHELISIERAINAIVLALRAGGRLVYVGAGTSGRLGVLDAAECGPTFSISADQVMALIAGGETALVHAVEGAEDDEAAGENDLASISLLPNDAVVGIAASGRTPYVLSAMKFARSQGCVTVGLSCNTDSELGRHVDYPIDVDTGPEMLGGSTRLKAGTAQKLVLNMISTIAMIQMGKTFGNLMVDLQVTNEKLHDRAIRIIEKATGASYEDCSRALESANRQVKVAILVILLGIDAETAGVRLASASGRVRVALEE